MPHSRRSLLKVAGTALATVSVAGCSTADDETPTDSASPTPTPTATPTPADTSTPTPTGVPTDAPSWLPVPSAVGTDHYTVTSASVETILTLAGALGANATAPFSGEYPVPGIDGWDQVGDVHQVVGIGTVTFASFDRATVEDAFRSTLVDVTERASRGYTLFEGGGVVGAVGDESVVTTGLFAAVSPADRRQTVEALVDAGVGGDRRYTDASVDVSLLTGAVGPSQIFRLRTHDGNGLPGAVADGIAYYLGTGTSRVEVPVVFTPGRVDETAVADWASEADLFADRDPTTSVSGRVVTAEATLPTSEIAAFTGRFPGT